MDNMDKLIKRAKKQDADAFTKLMQSQMQAMYKTARAMLHHDEDAADAISETILICWEKLEQLRKPEFFKTWMTRILINECNDILRQRKRSCPAEEVGEAVGAAAVSGSADAYDTVSDYETVEWLETLKGLDEKYRLVIILYYVNQFNTEEIASLLHMPASTVRTRLARGREQVAALYGVKNAGKEHYHDERKRNNG
ncbi:MAG: sigma-70 family RNA polymerase sigma factor [Clostridium sp.]|nr:sigma-70 family RNA polymerase sigma factor [Clostridium sp.]